MKKLEENMVRRARWLVIAMLVAATGCDIEFENETGDTDTPPATEDADPVSGTFTATLTSDAIDQEITGSAWFGASSLPTDEMQFGTVRDLYFTDDDENVYTADFAYIGRGELESEGVIWDEGTTTFASVAPDQSVYPVDAPVAVVGIGIDANTTFHFRSTGGTLDITRVDESGAYDAVVGSFTIELAGCQGFDCEGIGYDLTGTLTGSFEAANDDGFFSEIPQPLN